MPVPTDWTLEDVKYFLDGKEDGKPDFNPKLHLSLDKPKMIDYPPEPTADKAIKPARESTPVKIPAPIVNPSLTVKLGAVPSSQVELTCAKHPNYTGMRMGKTVAACLTCTAIYNGRKAKGVKETRTRKNNA